MIGPTKTCPSPDKNLTGPSQRLCCGPTFLVRPLRGSRFEPRSAWEGDVTSVVEALVDYVVFEVDAPGGISKPARASCERMLTPSVQFAHWRTGNRVKLVLSWSIPPGTNTSSPPNFPPSKG